MSRPSAQWNPALANIRQYAQIIRAVMDSDIIAIMSIKKMTTANAISVVCAY